MIQVKRTDMIPTLISKQELEKYVETATLYSTRGKAGLAAWARQFREAHARVPGGLSVEVGSHIGGSAILFGLLLEQMYAERVGDTIDPSPCPALWTVDPFGGKPYVGGHGAADQLPPIFGDREYQALKQNLCKAPYHAHWLMRSVDFFERLEGLTYWRPGDKTQAVLNIETMKENRLRIGEEKKAGKNSCAFILLDGEHSADSILKDFELAMRWLHPDGIIVIDNIDTDPYTLGRLREAGRAEKWPLELGPGDKPEWAIIKR